MKRIGQELQRLLRDEQGLSAIEYGILASLIALAAMQALGGLGGENAKSYDTAGNKLAEQRADSDLSNKNADQNSPDEPAAAAEAPMDENVDTTTPDEPPLAASKALP